MKIVGIDASTKVTALALIEDGKLVHHCSIDFSKEKDVDTRIDGILKEADKILKSWMHMWYSWNLPGWETTYRQQ